jgi:PHD/YefM family antitoxin component YafN of YafNO toxin-antitoxin module
MTIIKENFVTNAKGEKIGVLLPIKDYNKILDELEDLEDIKAYDKVMSRKQEFIPLNQALKEIEAARKKKK